MFLRRPGKKRPDSEIRSVFERLTLGIADVLLPPHGRFTVSARDFESDGGMMFLASVIDHVLH